MKNTIYYTLILSSLLVACNVKDAKLTSEQPNIILIMADDMGYGDVAYNANAVALTPCLDAMANEAVQLNRFYAAGPVCSPSRASCLTGRHPYRVGIPWAGKGYMHADETTIAEALKRNGYSTGHFGKWHVGGLSETVKQSYFPGDISTYSPPWENGYDECFVTESMMPTYNPYYQVGGDFGSEDYCYLQSSPVSKGQKEGGFRWRDLYWTGKGQIVDKWLEGDDSKIIMDQALDFIERKSKREEPFLSVIWFHAVHTPIVASNEDRSFFPNQTIEGQHWYGTLLAMDRQVGRLRTYLRQLDIDDNTIVWFCSDNGPSYIHNFNSTGGLRGKKAELYEGGIRVPSIIEWPAQLEDHEEVNVPMSTSDFYPTLLRLTNTVIAEDQLILDGEDVWPIIKDKKDRKKPIAFVSPKPARMKSETADSEQMALVDAQYKLISVDNGSTFQLYDLIVDGAEIQDVSSVHPDIKAEMQANLERQVAEYRANLKERNK